MPADVVERARAALAVADDEDAGAGDVAPDERAAARDLLDTAGARSTSPRRSAPSRPRTTPDRCSTRAGSVVRGSCATGCFAIRRSRLRARPSLRDAAPRPEPRTGALVALVAPALRRELGRWDLTAIGVNQVIGSAIFLLPADVARQIGAWGPMAFLVVGLASLLIALCFAEVGSRFDRTGGPYLPARVAYGRFIGFEVGWMMWFTRVASQASVSQRLALALAFYWPSLGRPALPRDGARSPCVTWR